MFDMSGEHTVARIFWNKHVYAESVEYPVSSLVQHTQIFTISVAVNYQTRCWFLAKFARLVANGWSCHHKEKVR